MKAPLALVQLAIAAALFPWLAPSGVSGAQDDGQNLRAGEWRSFGNDPAGSRYSPLTQIDASNFRELDVAWTWTSISTQVVKENSTIRAGQFKAVPLMVDGLLYVATELSQVAAIDAGAGVTIWQYDPESWQAGRPANVGFQHRGVAYWEDGEDRRVFIATHDRKLVALDAMTGEPIGGFGVDGVVDLLPEGGRAQLGRKVNERLLTHSSPPGIAGDTVVVGSIVHDGAIRQEAPPGHVRGFDARTGDLKWVFHTIPQEGEPGTETWENESWRYSGNTNVWSMFVADDELGAVYLPVSTPTNDFYGGHRLGDNLYAESIVCLDADTGERRWHFQTVHHGLWDYDLPTNPNLVDITVDGRAIKALAQVSKQAFTYVLDRRTGEPVWDIEERPVPSSDVPGERASPTQPFPTKPPPFDRQGVTLEDLVDFTPEIAAEAREIAKGYRLGPLFTPLSLPDEETKATLMLPSAGGGANWPGAAYDPTTQILYVPSSTLMSAGPIRRPDPARSDLRYVGTFTAGTAGPRGLPLVKPPWGRVTAIDLNSGEHLWMTPNGYGPRSHPALQGLDPGLLGGGSGAPLVTATLLFVTQRRGPGEENTPRINVFDKGNGDLLGHIPLPDTPNANPITYLHGGKQYIAVAVGGGSFFGAGESTTPQLIGLRLP